MPHALVALRFFWPMPHRLGSCCTLPQKKRVLWLFLPQKCHKFLISLTRTEKLEKFVACHIEKSNVTSNVTFCDIVACHKKPFSTKTFQPKKTFTNKNHPKTKLEKKMKQKQLQTRSYLDHCSTISHF